MSRGPKRGSGTRSNMYSESKYTNWREFDPLDGEIEALPPSVRPSLILEFGDERIPIFQHGVHHLFVSPVTPQDVYDTLCRVPVEYLKGLEGVHLLGGTAKQHKVALGELACYGRYVHTRIYLSAFPKKLLVERHKRLPPPHVVQEYERVGASYRQDRNGWVFTFTMESLRDFYLRDVLLHEIGHHVDRRNTFDKNAKAAERYAAWFARYCEKQMEPASNE